MHDKERARSKRLGLPHAAVQDLANGSQTALLCQLAIDCSPASIYISVRASRSKYVEVLVTFDVSKFILEENDAVILG